MNNNSNNIIENTINSFRFFFKDYIGVLCFLLAWLLLVYLVFLFLLYFNVMVSICMFLWFYYTYVQQLFSNFFLFSYINNGFFWDFSDVLVCVYTFLFYFLLLWESLANLEGRFSHGFHSFAEFLRCFWRLTNELFFAY